LYASADQYATVLQGKLTSGDDGLISFEGLHPEMLYRLTETKAPEGLMLQADYAFEGSLPLEGDFAITVTVLNCPEFELPKTGASTLLLMQLGGTVAMAAGIVVSARNKKRRV